MESEPHSYVSTILNYFKKQLGLSPEISKDTNTLIVVVEDFYPLYYIMQASNESELFTINSHDQHQPLWAILLDSEGLVSVGYPLEESNILPLKIPDLVQRTIASFRAPYLISTNHTSKACVRKETSLRK